MPERPIFDPFVLFYKNPFGAVACAEGVTFSVCPPAKEGFSRCFLLTHREFADTWLETPLAPVAEGFSGVYTAPAEGELVFYHFRFERGDGSSICYGAAGFCDWQHVASWQLTVYERTPTPKWFGAGITYQIFPDRFHRSRLPETTGMLGQRQIHHDWSEPVTPPSADAGTIPNADFFGGDLAGITEKLDYLKSLGVTTLYLNPIFLSASNHRYNTADYLRIDPMLGTEADFSALCAAAKARGIHVLLDGVFNHTGSNSLYFNAEGAFPTVGAAQSQTSPFYPWYHFTDWPAKYDAWWGVPTLPAVCEDAPGYADYIIDAPDSVIRHWLRAGADGWRLDVADELPDWFIVRIRAAMVQEKPDAFLLGEVWEDGSNKISYGARRRYLLGDEVHGLMNYPFRAAALAYLKGGDAADFRRAMETLREHYPPAAFYSAMNFLSTHDTPRILTVLGMDTEPQDTAARAAFRLTQAQRAHGLRLLKLAAALLFTFPGSPTIYYGDEAGMEGLGDPFNRATFPWGQADTEVTAHFAALGRLRRALPALQRGTIEYCRAEGSVLIFCRTLAPQRCYTLLNAGDDWTEAAVPWESDFARDALSPAHFPARDGTVRLALPPYSAFVLCEDNAECFT